MMQRKKPDVDTINDVLLKTMEAFPENEFVKSLYRQYHERGGLSKKQLQGLYAKASKIKGIATGKLATLQAIILRKPSRYKSAMPGPSPLYRKDEAVGNMIQAILKKFPQHKQVLFLKTKYDNNEVLTATEVAGLQRFFKLLKPDTR